MSESAPDSKRQKVDPAAVSVKSFMVKRDDVAMCKPQHTLEVVAFSMRDSKIGCVVVDSAEPSEEPVGVITKTDLVIAAFITCSEEGVETKAVDAMSSKLVTINENKSAADAAKLMTEEGIHHLMVVDDDGIFSGLVSTLTIAAQLLEPQTQHKAFLKHSRSFGELPTKSSDEANDSAKEVAKEVAVNNAS